MFRTFIKQTTRAKLFPFIGLLFLVSCEIALSDKQKTDAAQSVKDGYKLSAEQSQTWNDVVGNRAGIPQTSQAKCDVEVIPGVNASGDDLSAKILLGNVKGKRFAAHLFREPIKKTDKSPRARKAERVLSSVDFYIRPSTKFDDEPALARALDRIAIADEIADLGYWTHDLTILIDAESEAKIDSYENGVPRSTTEQTTIYHTTTKTKFEPGSISGRAFVYDYVAQKIVCAGKFHARNSNGIQRFSRDDLRFTLRDDLRGRAIMAALTSLKRVND